MLFLLLLWNGKARIKQAIKVKYNKYFVFVSKLSIGLHLPRLKTITWLGRFLQKEIKWLVLIRKQVNIRRNGSFLQPKNHDMFIIIMLPSHDLMFNAKSYPGRQLHV